MSDDHVSETLSPFADYYPAEREVDELNGDSGMTCAWVIEVFDGEREWGDLYVYWHEDGDTDRRDEFLRQRFIDFDWEVQYP